MWYDFVENVVNIYQKGTTMHETKGCKIYLALRHVLHDFIYDRWKCQYPSLSLSMTICV